VVASEPSQHPTRSVLLLFLALALFSCSDLLGKILNAALPPIEIAWLRYVAFTALVLPWALKGGVRGLATSQPGLQILRGFGLMGSAVLFVSSVRYMPLAEATATGFMSPVFITALSVIFLGERPGVRRWSAVAAGIVGMLLVVKPGAGAFQWAALFAIASAATWAVAMIVTRRMGLQDSVATTLFWTAATGFLAVTLLLPFAWVPPTPQAVAIGLLIGVINTVAQWLTVLAYRHADASLLAPLSYTQLIWAAIWGFLVFGAVPDAGTIAGAAIIAGSGLYIAHRERVVSRKPQPV
jgi:drug/metabolite transporter (DMT)-like permease